MTDADTRTRSSRGLAVRRGWTPRVPELIGAVLAAALVVAAVVVARRRNEVVTPLLDGMGFTFDDFAALAPLFGQWGAHVGPGTPVAVVVGVLVVIAGPSVASRLSWWPLMASAWAASLVWIVGLAAVDGWQRGFVDRLTSRDEYLSEVGGIDDIGAMLRGFSDRIVDGQSDSWATHVSGHPPGAILTFVWLDRLGLGGGAAAAWLCVIVGSSAAVATAVAVAALVGRDRARRLIPFTVVAPSAIWIGVSADGFFTGVSAWGVALLAVAATGRRPRHDAAAAAAGVLLGFSVYLNYGLTLMALPALAVLIASRRVRPLIPAVGGALVVAAVFTAAGFWWFDGYVAVQERYWQGIASARPFQYWSWANIAALVCAVGLAVPAALSRVVSLPRLRRAEPVTLLVAAALLAVAFADLSRLSKAETERIWLPFQVWLTVAAVSIGDRSVRFWLTAQVALSLAINHLTYTNW
ncbi:hypothetical protein SAMN05444374_103279 [Rhodococcoides kroppenstedtii]|uniref:Integral membrane protein n=1 Tax=Rhodococcoides kroppenstedtii TaxID=293050 RepID=A0A1I0T1M0_9NOCA|nr:hypothetical protein SAMN05444374_103279 [Rhodococcus kroppenstedtii]